MKALRYENGALSVSDIAEPVADGEALVRVTLSGICNTALEIARGYARFEGTLGHEFVGIIEQRPGDGTVARQTGAPARAARVGWAIGRPQSEGILRVGDRIVGEINAGCGVCDLCRAGDPRH